MTKTFTKDELWIAIKQDRIGGRSKWAQGVRDYAMDLMETLPNDWMYSNDTMLEKELLNGADDWAAYSWGGCALCYDCDICERLATPSEQKRKKGGDLQPSSCESWLDVQTRALRQAFYTIRRLCRYYSNKQELILGNH